jgi:hypothetical protein
LVLAAIMVSKNTWFKIAGEQAAALITQVTNALAKVVFGLQRV